MPSRAFEAVIGLEVHAQLKTRTKAFCACPVVFGAPANTAVCPVCLGYPGALPVPNREMVALALRVDLATGCAVHEVSIFARKNYFYPDLPKGYQISQFDRPLATGGGIDVRGEGAPRAGSASTGSTSRRTPGSRCTRRRGTTSRRASPSST